MGKNELLGIAWSVYYKLYFYANSRRNLCIITYEEWKIYA